MPRRVRMPVHMRTRVHVCVRVRANERGRLWAWGNVGLGRAGGREEGAGGMTSF